MRTLFVIGFFKNHGDDQCFRNCNMIVKIRKNHSNITFFLFTHGGEVTKKSAKI